MKQQEDMMRRAIIAVAVLVVPALAWAAGEVILDAPGGNVRQKGTSAGSAYVYEKGGYAKTAGCVEVVCSTVGDGGLLNVTVETDYELSVDDNSGVRLANGVSCVAYGAGGVGKRVNASTSRYWRAPAGAGTDGGVAKYECCSGTAGTIVQACPR